jgi:tetratricopeptide (TPR) repeat protein
MSRFKNLEFSGGFEDEQISRPALKDEPFYLSEARQGFEQGRFEQALRAYAKVLEFNPGNAAAWSGQVRMLIELGEFREAKLWADKALENFPTDPDLLAAKAVALARSGDSATALIFSDAAVEAKGNSPYAWLARGDVLLARKEKRAAYCFDKAIGLAPRDWFIRWLAARIHLFYRQFSRALKLAQEALDLNATQGVVWLELGRCQQALGLIGPAENSFAQARQLDPSSEAAGAALTQLTQANLWTRLLGFWRQVRRS